MVDKKPGVAPGVTLNEQFRLRADFTKIIAWWERLEASAYQRLLAEGEPPKEDPRCVIAWGLILAGMQAAGYKVDQVEEVWSVKG